MYLADKAALHVYMHPLQTFGLVIRAISDWRVRDPILETMSPVLYDFIVIENRSPGLARPTLPA